jgi:hypothetical protein
MENNLKPERNIKPINFWLLGIGLILLGASLFLNISHTIITNESVVLAFIGVLATFIVVGNYAQVTEIRNDTKNQIKDLETKTQTKIDELNKLYEKIKEIEINTNYNSAEAYRLYGVYTYDKKEYKKSVVHLIHSILFYNKSGRVPRMLDTILNTILINLKPEKWNQDTITKDFDYQESINKVKKFPDNYMQKQKIIDLLEKNMEGQKKVV